MISMKDSEELLERLKAVDKLVDSKVFTKERGDIWKNRIIDEFEATVIPAPIEKKLPNDISHLPGRIVQGGIEVAKAVARGSGATYEGLSRREGYLDTPPEPALPKEKTQVVQPIKKTPNIIDLYNNMPEDYK